MKLIISKSQWEEMGKKAGWMSPDTKFHPDDPIYGNDLSHMTDEDWKKLDEAQREKYDRENGKPKYFVEVTFDDGDVVKTSINGTKKEIEDYYLKQDFTKNDESGKHRGVKVKFLDYWSVDPMPTPSQK